MTKTRRLCLFFVLLSGAISVLWGFSIGHKNSGGPTDFQAVYYGAECLLQHHDPYRVSDMKAVYFAANEGRPFATERERVLATLFVNLPTTFLLFAPITVLPLGMAQVLWLVLTAGSLLLAGVLMWDLGEKHSPILSTCLIAFLLANSEYVFSTGNTAGIVVGLCVIGAWCFLQDGFVLAGILCMAVSLAIKPHDAGLVWLYFLLAGGIHRKRALQSLVVTAALAFSAILWVSLVVPNWMQDWRSNMAAISARGGLNDPGPATLATDTFAKVISLQAVFSVFRDDPRFYNLATYLVCGVLLLVWVIATLRSRSSQEKDWLALAAIVPLTLLVTYHRVYDAKLVLLTVPACAMLWAKGGPIRWIALGISAAGVVVCSDVPLIFFEVFAEKLQLSTSVLSGQVLTVILGRPATVSLLVVSVFYLWVYVRSAFTPLPSALPEQGKRERSASAIA
jgi:hypothetical protein